MRVVHRKSLSSPNREPVLKAKVRRWLTQREEVLAYCEAPPRDSRCALIAGYSYSRA